MKLTKDEKILKLGNAYMSWLRERIEEQIDFEFKFALWRRHIRKDIAQLARRHRATQG